LKALSEMKALAMMRCQAVFAAWVRDDAPDPSFRAAIPVWLDFRQMWQDLESDFRLRDRETKKK
jgi:hypothetical protein